MLFIYGACCHNGAPTARLHLLGPSLRSIRSGTHIPSQAFHALSSQASKPKRGGCQRQQAQNTQLEAKAAAKLSARSLLHTDLHINFSKSLPIKTLNQEIQWVLKLPLFLWETLSARTQLSSHCSRGWMFLQEAFPQSLCFNTPAHRMNVGKTLGFLRGPFSMSHGSQQSTLATLPWLSTGVIPTHQSSEKTCRTTDKLLRISTNPSILQPAYLQPCNWLLKAHHTPSLCPEGPPASQQKQHTEILS